MCDVINGFLKAAGWKGKAVAYGAGGAAVFGAGVYTGAKLQRELVRGVVGSAMNLSGVGTPAPSPTPAPPALPMAEEPMKTAGWPLVLGGAALLGAGAFAGAKLQKNLARGAIMKGDAYQQQVRQKQLQRQGSFAAG